LNVPSYDTSRISLGPSVTISGPSKPLLINGGCNTVVDPQQAVRVRVVPEPQLQRLSVEGVDKLVNVCDSPTPVVTQAQAVLADRGDLSKDGGSMSAPGKTSSDQRGNAMTKLADPQERVPANRWTDAQAEKVASSVKKLYVVKRESATSTTYVITAVFNDADNEVRLLLRKYVQGNRRDLIVQGRPVKRILERILPFLREDLKPLAVTLLAFPVGRRKKDVKERLFQQFCSFFQEWKKVRDLQRLSEEGPQCGSCDSLSSVATRRVDSVDRLTMTVGS